MAGDRKTVEELAKLRLKLVEKKIAAERQKSAQKQTFVENLTVDAGYNDPHHALQAEILKSQQLLEQVQEERHQLRTRHQQSVHGNSQHSIPKYEVDKSDTNSEIVAMVLAQSVPLQGMMLKQMNSAPPQNDIDRTSRPRDIEQVSYREMTPFTSLPQNKPAVKAPAPVLPAPPRKASPAKVPRMAATPVRSTDHELLRQPRPKTKTPPVTGFLNKPSLHDPVDSQYPFPGTKGIRKLRHVFLATWFCFILITILKKLVKRRLENIQRIDECIKASIVELHEKYYLNQDNPIWTAMYDLIKEGCFNAKVNSPGIFQKLSQEDQATLTELSSIVETVIHNITEIRPSKGLLGPTREGVLWYMLQPNVFLPSDYLWECEKNKLQLTDQGSIAHQDKSTGVLLVVGLFISRGLVSSILLQPEESGLCPNSPSAVAKTNLKVLASILMKIVREVSVPPKSKAMPIPSEISKQVFSDDEMKYIFKKLDGSLIWSKANLSRWASGFVDMVNKE